MDSEAPGRLWVAVLILLCLGALWLEFRHIGSTLPYPRHVDEGFIAAPAYRTVVTGTLHPETFRYPSLPKYLAAAGVAIGFVRGAAHREVNQIAWLGNVGYPYYGKPRPIRTARQVFAVLSVIALAATGASAWIASRRSATILLAPLILLSTPLFFFHSWNYLNVDIVGTCVVTLMLAACLLGTRRPTLPQSALIPGVLVGLAAGSKYTLAVMAFPVLLAITFEFTGARRRWAWVAALTAAAAGFVAAVPYCLIDIPGFLDGLAWEASHYASGHRGFMADPGWPQLVYYTRHFVSQFGIAGMLLALIGFVRFAVADWRRAAVLASFPVALLALLASQRAHFPRNVLPLHPVIAMFAAMGLVTLHSWVLGLPTLQRWSARGSRRLVSAVVGVVLLIATVPLWHFVGHLRDRTDSRLIAAAWIQARIPPDWAVVVAEQLGFDPRDLEAKGRRVVAVDLMSARDAGALTSVLNDAPTPAVILLPRWGADARYPGGEVALTLNALSRRWRPMATFGTNDVLVNYSHTVPLGDPAFSIAPLN